MDYEYSLLGKTIAAGKYRVEELIGKGAFAHVYRVKHLRLDVDRALKVLHRDWSEIGSNDIRNFHERFQVEAQLLARIHKSGVQPHVIQVFDVDFDEQGGFLYQEMEYAPGGNLSTLIHQYRDDNQYVPLYTVFKWGIEASKGLASLHKIDIVHRDVKPANILLGADGMVKIADLGLAQTPGSRIGQGSLAVDHPGTTEYMPPEQLPGQKMALRACADVYAMGCVLFEALTGQIYYHHPGERVSDSRSEIPAWLDDLVTRCLSQAAGDRPRDGLQLSELLQRGAEQQRRDDEQQLRENINELKRSCDEALRRLDWNAALQNVEELRLLGEEGQSAAMLAETQIQQARQKLEEADQKQAAILAAQKDAELKRLQETAEEALSASQYPKAAAIAVQMKALGPAGLVTAEQMLARISAAELEARERVRLQQEQRSKQIMRLKQLAEKALQREEWATVAGLIGQLTALGSNGTKTANELQEILKKAQQEARKRDQKAALLKWQSWLKSKTFWAMMAVFMLVALGFTIGPTVMRGVNGQIVERNAQKTAFAMMTQTDEALKILPTQTLAGFPPAFTMTPTQTLSIFSPTFTITPAVTLTWTPLPTATLTPTATNTYRPAATNPPVSLPTNTPRPPAPTNTPQPPAPTAVPQPSNTPVPPQPTATSDVRPPTPTPP